MMRFWTHRTSGLIGICSILLTSGFSADGPGLGAAEPLLRLQLAPQGPEVAFLSWDTEGGDKVQRNLLRSDQAMTLRVRTGGQWLAAASYPTKIERVDAATTAMRLTIDRNVELTWTLTTAPDSLAMTFVEQGPQARTIEGVELRFPFDPGVTPTTVLPSQWADDGTLRLPAILSAPDFGQMLLAESQGRRLSGRLEGSRTEKTVDFVVEVALDGDNKPCSLALTPLRLPAPEGLADLALWTQARRGWFGAWQPSARWGDQNRPFSAPPGILANNVISDPASCSLWFYADQALWTPQLTPEISLTQTLRRGVDFWLLQRTRPTGEVVCYWDYGNFLDANAGPLIAAWDYVESTGDTAWLKTRIERLELIADFLAHRDIDADGMVEAVQSGNRGTLKQPDRSCAWFDAINCGHKDGYTNALIYRAWRCLADLEQRLGRAEQATRYHDLADRLKASYAKTLFNPATGWLAWWKSEDGELHDYATPIVNGLAIEYGLVERDQGQEILARLWEKIEEVGFERFDLGVPPMLSAVRRDDYLLPDALGIPQREDGTDTLGHYQNGGITAGQVLHFLAAHYVVEQPEKADRVLRAMLQRQVQGQFQNGVRDAGGQGVDWTDWQGNPTGYEGYLADSFRFLQAVLLREATFRSRLYRPLTRPTP
ncbi:MAG: alpha-L-rhamnosidase-related protein [Pirellulaceae bacterium]